MKNGIVACLVIILCSYLLLGEVDSKTGASPKLKEPFKVKKLLLFKDNAGRPEWSPNGNKYITYHARGEDNYYDAYIMDADGSNERCLTDHLDLPNKHAGQPSWHPSGEWIAFQAEKEKHVFPKVGLLAVPGIGWHNDVYVMSIDGKKVYRLTDLKTQTRIILDWKPACAILQPHFSNDGTLLSWAERVGNEARWGKWVIRLADFSVVDGIPKIENKRTLKPGKNKHYYESNDFTPDDKKLIICGDLDGEKNEYGIDIYTLDLESEEVQRLTNTSDEFDECPHPSPDGKKIAYLSTRGFEPNEENELWWEWAKGEFWLMDSDGGNQQQLTHFNTEGYPEYIGKRVIPANISWNEDGTKLLLGIAVEEKERELKDQLWLLEFE
jgi:Tol biopolymer transport system component